MASKPKNAAEADNTPTFDAEAITELQNSGAALNALASEEHALVNQLLGQAQMADSIAKFSRTVRLTKLAYVKENRLYKALAGQTMPNRSALKGTWEEFCGLLGYSKDKVDLDLQNLRAFGEEALESMSRMGIGYREMRQFRKLPDDQQAALIEVAKAGDKDAFIDLAEEVITKHSQEKAQLTTERDEARADYEAQSELLSQKSQALDEARQELTKAQRRLAEATPDEAEKQLKIEISGMAVEIESLFKTRLDGALQTLAEHATTSGTDQRTYMATLVRQMELELHALREKYDLPDDLTLNATEDDFAWLKPDALEAAAAEVAEHQPAHLKGDAGH